MSNMRHRSRTTENPPRVAEWNVGFEHHHFYSINSPASAPNSVTTEEMYDEVTENFHSRKASGELLPVNDMTKINRFFLTEESSWNYDCWGDVYKGGKWISEYLGISTLSGNLDVCLIPTSVDNHSFFGRAEGALPNVSVPTGKLNQMSIQALKRARAASFDSLTFAAEMKESVRLLKSVSKMTQKRAQTLANSPKVKNLEDFQKFWLEARFGWRPILYELQALKELQEKLFEGKAPIRRGTSYATLLDYEATDTINWQPPNMGSFTSYIGTYTNSVTTRGGWDVRTGAAVRNSGRNLAFADPLVTAGEVLPYLVLLNMFVNIKDNLGAFSPFAHEELLWNWVTIRAYGETTITASPKGHISGRTKLIPKTGNPFSSVFTTERISRTKVPPPSPALRFRLDLDVAQAIDALLLSISLLRRIYRRLEQLRKP